MKVTSYKANGQRHRVKEHSVPESKSLAFTRNLTDGQEFYLESTFDGRVVEFNLSREEAQKLHDSLGTALSESRPQNEIQD